MTACKLGINFYSFNDSDTGNQLFSATVADNGHVTEMIHPENPHGIT